MTDGSPMQQDGAARRSHLCLALILALAAALFLAGIGWGLPATDSWAIDSIAPKGPLAIAADLSSPKWYIAYPLMHYFVLISVYAPYLAWLFLTGGLAHPTAHYPYGFSNVLTTFTVLIVLARLVSVAMALGMVLLVWKIARKLFGEAAAGFSALMIGISAMIVFYAHTSNLDVPYNFWFVLSLWLLVKGATGGSLKYCILAGAAGAATVATKDQSAALFVGYPVAIWFHWRRAGGGPEEETEGGRRRGALRAIMWLILAMALAYGVVNILPSPSRFMHHVAAVFLDLKNVRQHSYTPWGLSLLAADVVRELWMGTGAFVAAGVLGLGYVLARERDRRHLFWLLPLATYFFGFLAMVGYTFYRFTMPVLVCLSFPAGVFASVLWARLRHVAARIALVAVLVAPSLYLSVCQDLRLVCDTRYAVESYLGEHARPGDVLETYRTERYMPRFPEGMKVAFIDERGMNFDALSRRRPDWILLLDFREFAFGFPQGAQAYLSELAAGKAGYTVAQRVRLDIPPRRTYVAPDLILLHRDGPGPSFRGRGVPAPRPRAGDGPPTTRSSP